MRVGIIEVRRATGETCRGAVTVEDIADILTANQRGARVDPGGLSATGWRAGILSWRYGNCWGKERRYRHPQYSGSRRSGRENTSSGGGRRLKRAIGRICGRTGSM